MRRIFSLLDRMVVHRTAIAVLLLPIAGRTASLSQLVSRTGPIKSDSVLLKRLSLANQYSLLYSVSPLRGLGPDARVLVEIRQRDRVLASKILHPGDPDYYTQFRVRYAGTATVTVKAHRASGNYVLQVNRWPTSTLVKSSPSHRWQDAISIPLDKVVFASGDDEE